MNNNLNSEWCNRFNKSLERHIGYVKEAANIVGGIPERILSIHDASKYSVHEYCAYVNRFGGGAKYEDEFNMAWLHHIHENPHHPEHWVIPSGHEGSEVILPMPEVYAREIVADWMGASMAYTGSWDMGKWLTIRFDSIKLHPETMLLVRQILKDIGQDIR